MNNLIWYYYWQLKPKTYITDITLHKIIKIKREFFPEVKHCILIHYIATSKTFTLETSFNILLRVKA